MKIERRKFIGAGSLAIAGAMAHAADKTTDGGFAAVSNPGVPKRKFKLLPAGSCSEKNFSTKCVGCQLCVQTCPNGVLRAGANMQPVMAFDRGYCRSECVRCSKVCPTGAILPITIERKKHIHIGHAHWKSSRCLAIKDGISCTSCVDHCPVKAIKLVRLKENDLSSPNVPVVDKNVCIGCGACEHLCPARPMPAMVVSGHPVHREITPANASGVIEEAERLVDGQVGGAVLVKDGMIVAHEKGRGISPLLKLLDTKPELFKGAVLVDKIVGRAAAAIAVSGGAVEVHALLMSEGAKVFLEKHSIKVTAKEMTSQIINRKKTGMCPFEEKVKDSEKTDEMISLIRELQSEFAKKNNAAKSR
jgi:ferredoxin-type protein NapF